VRCFGGGLVALVGFVVGVFVVGGLDPQDDLGAGLVGARGLDEPAVRARHDDRLLSGERLGGPGEVGGRCADEVVGQRVPELADERAGGADA
jgi:hypothetical protein